MMSFPPHRAAGLARMQEYIPEAPRYAATRNHVTPGNRHVSLLSPYLQPRLLREDELAAAVLAQHPFATVAKFIQEVYWRTYWKGWLETRPEAWARYRLGLARVQNALPAEMRSRWQAALVGRTGLACFDDWVKELLQTGWLHNHVRMWFASIWMFTLRLPWELGAAFFEQQLIDADAASNTLSWRWVVGLQTPGKIYLARHDNIARCTAGRWTPAAGALAATGVSLNETPVARQEPWAEAAEVATLPARLPRGARVGLWLHPEDLSVEQGELAPWPIAAIYAGWPVRLAAALQWSELVIAFKKAALADAAERAGAHFACPVAAPSAPELVASLLAWAQAERVHVLVAYRPQQGPWFPLVADVERACAEVGIKVYWRRRAWDALWFPYATRGYFPFWQQVKENLGVVE